MSLPSLVALPPSLLPFVSRAEESFLAAAGSLSDAIAARCRAWLVEQREAFGRVCAASDFVSEQVSRDPQMLLQLAELGWLDRSLAPVEMRDALSEQVAACDSEEDR
ncbi:MAG TPA: bifunctional glutamine synthetase adenylyltransferase/deadenyltransferase, partial [Pseudomonas sp.]|nr:bifunctional glutamine synthetase adenylyltransferase/deadenyltransferase [Pseudomonas sp.]